MQFKNPNLELVENSRKSAKIQIAVKSRELIKIQKNFQEMLKTMICLTYKKMNKI